MKRASDTMQLLLTVLLALTALGAIAVGAMARELHTSDAAGNGLAQGFHAISLGGLWLALGVGLTLACLTPAPPALPGGLRLGVVHTALVGLFGLGLAAQALSLPWLYDGRNQGAWRATIVAAGVLVPLALLTLGAWRGAVVALPATATWVGGAALVALGALAPIAAKALVSGRHGTAEALTVHHVPYPALLFHGESAVTVVRDAAALTALLEAPTLSPEGTQLVDANAATYPWPDTERPGWRLARDPEPLVFDELLARVARIPRLAADPAEDAEVRRLASMQRSVSALSFVLPRASSR